MASHGVKRPATTEQRTELARQQEEKQIKEYKALIDLINVKVSERQYTVETFDLTTKLLKWNPEYYTIWNVRRRLLTSGLFSKPSDSSLLSPELQNISPTATIITSSGNSSSSATSSSADPNTTPRNPASPTPGKNGITLDLIREDLAFIFKLMLSHPKCYWIWNYRLWLLEEANRRLFADVARELWSQELILVGKMLTKDSRNFHGWGYRRKVVAELESPKLHGQSMVESEFEYTTKMINAPRGLSNFSAWHNRSKLIPRLLNERRADVKARRQFLDDEFDLIIGAMYTDAYPYQQSTWFYYQFLMTTLINPIGHATITPNMTPEERVEFVIRQLANLRDMLDGAEDNKWIYNALLEYTVELSRMEERTLESDEREDCKLWLAQLREMDPLRAGRWDDLETKLEFLTAFHHGVVC